MIILGIIPARYGSSRFPGKPLADISGKTMIQRVYEQARKSRTLTNIIVATDDRRIFNCVMGFGGNVIMTSARHRSGTERICEVVRQIRSDITVNIQGDEPLIPSGNIDLAVRALIKDKSLRVSTLAVKFGSEKEASDRNKVKVVFGRDYEALYFSRSVIPCNFRNKTGVRYYKHIGLYAYRTDFLKNYGKLKKVWQEDAESLEQLRMLHNGIRIKIVLTKNDSISVDTPEDIKTITRKYKLRKH